MKKSIKYLLINFTVLLLLSSCASVVNTTGSVALDTDIESITIYCTSPRTVAYFSDRLCHKLQSSLIESGINTSVKIIDEMVPVIEKDSTQSQYIMNIDHVRVTLINGLPCNTLLNVSMTKNNDSTPFWAARIFTKGSNSTGPGNPKRVSQEILEQMSADGLIGKYSTCIH